MPETATTLGELAALLTTVTILLMAPELAGLKINAACRAWPGASVAGRDGAERAKALLPELIELTVAFTVPVLVTVRACAADADPTDSLPKLMDAGPTEIDGGTGAVPVPETVTLLGELEALLVTATTPLKDPALAGLNVTLAVSV